MNRFAALLGRNIRLFVRDRATVFFSWMSALILIALYFLFIAKQYVNGMMTGATGVALGGSEDEAYFLIYLQMMAGVMVLNSVSFCTGVYSTVAKDYETRRIDALLLTHTKTHELLLSYLATGFIVSYVMNLVTWGITTVLIRALTGYTVGMEAFFAAAGVLLFASFIGASFMLLATALVKSSAAIGVITGIVGTFLGFLCGIYMPLSQLGSAAETVGSVIPFTHVAIWLKGIVINDAMETLGIKAEEFKEAMLSNFTAENIGFLGIEIPLYGMLLLCAAGGIICGVIAYKLLARRVR